MPVTEKPARARFLESWPCPQPKPPLALAGVSRWIGRWCQRISTWPSPQPRSSARGAAAEPSPSPASQPPEPGQPAISNGSSPVVEERQCRIKTHR